MNYYLHDYLYNYLYCCIFNKTLSYFEIFTENNHCQFYSWSNIFFEIKFELSVHHRVAITAVIFISFSYIIHSKLT